MAQPNLNGNAKQRGHKLEAGVGHLPTFQAFKYWRQGLPNGMPFSVSQISDGHWKMPGNISKVNPIHTMLPRPRNEIVK